MKQLDKQIEELRKQMYQAYENKLSYEEILSISKQLDIKINEKLKLQKERSTKSDQVVLSESPND